MRDGALTLLSQAPASASCVLISHYKVIKYIKFYLQVFVVKGFRATLEFAVYSFFSGFLPAFFPFVGKNTRESSGTSGAEQQFPLLERIGLCNVG
jgi:hypothetical protein